MDRGITAAGNRRLIRPATARLLLLALFWAALVFALVMAVIPRPPDLPGAPSDKVQHILAFAVLSALALAAYPRTGPLKIGISLTLFGALIEVAQMIPWVGRDGSWLDMAADCAATVLILLLGTPVRRRVLRRFSAP